VQCQHDYQELQAKSISDMLQKLLFLLQSFCRQAYAACGNCVVTIVSSATDSAQALVFFNPSMVGGAVTNEPTKVL
jgi:hypothetical protein